MKKLGILIKSIAMIVFIYQLLFAGHEDWDKVSKEILQLKKFEQDSSADAIYLFRKGEMEITRDFKIKLIVHERMKIFNEEGKDVANVVIPFSKYANFLELKAQTILPNGKKIKVEDFYEEKVGNFWKQKKFTFPGVVDGAVVETKFVMLIDNLSFPPEWQFQSRYYTLKSEFKFAVRFGFVFTVNYRNPLQFDLTPEKYEKASANLEKVTVYKWELNDIPAFEPEPYMPAKGDYQTSLSIQFQEYNTSDFYYKFVKTWKDLNKVLVKDIQTFFNADDQIQEILDGLHLDSLENKEKIRKIYNYVRDNFEDQNFYFFGSYKTAKDVLKKKEGASSDLNLLLIYLLRKAGFEAYPMLISTRSHGQVNVMWPGLRNFNRQITYLKDGFSKYYMDVSYKLLPYDLPAPANLVQVGFVLGENQGQIIALKKSKKKSKTIIKEFFTFDEDDELVGKVSVKFQDYAAFYRRSDLEDKKPEDFIKDILKDTFTEFELDTFKIENIDDPDVPLVVKFEFRVPDFLEETGDKYYLTLPLLSRMEKNPFVREKRLYPISFSHPSQVKESAVFAFRGKYKIVDIPKLKVISIPGALKYKLKFMRDQNGIKVIREFKRQRDDFKVSEYQLLKEKYAKIINADNIQLILEGNEDNLSVKSE